MYTRFVPISTFLPEFIECKESILTKPQSTVKEFILDNPTININVVTLTGKRIPLQISKYDTIERLKKQIYVTEKILIDQQKYTFKGVGLTDTNTLDHYGITSDSSIYLILRLRGGMFHSSSARRDWVSLNYITKLQTGIHMIEHMRSYGIYLDTLNDLQKELEKCSTDQEIDLIFALIEKYYIK
jgi:hypothetical protein